jgi:hypothetical protein
MNLENGEKWSQTLIGVTPFFSCYNFQIIYDIT